MNIKISDSAHPLPPPGPRALATMEKLLDSAERLFAQQGVLTASVRDITTMAGQRNASAMHYHFGGREGLVTAVLSRHAGRVAQDRTQLMAELGNDIHVASLMRVVVEPLANRLLDETGCRYLLIQEQCLTIPGLAAPATLHDEAMQGLRETLQKALTWIPAHVLARRFEFVIAALLGALAIRARARLDAVKLSDSDAVYIDDLVEMLAAAMAAPLPLLMG